MKKVLQVAVGVVKNADGEILIALRDPASHQGGLWEFPGGKIEPGETIEQALNRELKEELGIVSEAAQPLLTLHHDYPDLSVCLNVWTVEKFHGCATSCEGQPIKWVKPGELVQFTFPRANQAIVSAVRLPPYYAILDDDDEAGLWTKLTTLLAKDIKLIQARLKSLSKEKAAEFLAQAYPLCRRAGVDLLINSSVQGYEHLSADGIHLTARHLLALSERPDVSGWLAASCHNWIELQQARKLGVDFVVLAPVLPTVTHPGAKHLGWELFAELVARIDLPVYGLGGLLLSDLDRVRQCGGQGIAGIRTFK